MEICSGNAIIVLNKKGDIQELRLFCYELSVLVVKICLDVRTSHLNEMK